MDLKKAQDLCIALMQQYNLTSQTGWSFSWIKSLSCAGKCRYNRNASRQYYGGIIKLSVEITQIHSDEEVRDTILHEIAHGLTPGHHHDYVWQRKATEIGCSGSRCFDVCEGLKEVRLQKAKYIATCKLCGHVFSTTRLPKREQWCKCTRRTFRQDEKLIWNLNDSRKADVPMPKSIPTPRIPIGVSRGYQQFKAHTSFPDTLLLQAPDAYKRMLDKFETDFLMETTGEINREVFEKIVMKAKTSSNSWRTMNREVRKACDAYCVEYDIMSHKDFQEKYFYEGVMNDRTTWGKNAPWINGKPS